MMLKKDKICFWIHILFICFLFKLAKSDDCTFYEGSTSFYKTCTNGCCETECCEDNYRTLAIILGTVFGCLLLIIIIVVIVICCTKSRWSKKGVKPKRNGRVSLAKNDDDIVLTEMGKKSST